MTHSNRDVIIRVENVSKLYRLGEVGTGSLAHDIKRWWHLSRGRGDPYAKIGQSNDRTQLAAQLDYAWALRNVSFEVRRGEAFGIIGRNGAGKSTLLKILSRVTTQTEGRIKVRGRIASLLEVGTGFHPELTGRENIFLNGAILGMRKAEISRKFDEIVEFSGCARYIDTPVKRYSSGMYVRLAFAVAAHLEPEILIVDEVLAVGDAEFQKKCLGKMKDVAGHGRTVIFVSHNMPAVLQFTKICMLLNCGKVEYMGKTSIAVEKYMAGFAEENQIEFDLESKSRKSDDGYGAARLLSLRFDRVSPIFRPFEDFQFIAKVKAFENISNMRFSITFFAPDGSPVGSCFGDENISISCGKIAFIHVNLPQPKLAPGRYCCALAIGKGNHKSGFTNFDLVQDTLFFEVHPEEGDHGTLSKWAKSWGSIIFDNLQQKNLTSLVNE